MIMSAMENHRWPHPNPKCSACLTASCRAVVSRIGMTTFALAAFGCTPSMLLSSAVPGYEPDRYLCSHMLTASQVRYMPHESVTSPLMMQNMPLAITVTAIFHSSGSGFIHIATTPYLHTKNNSSRPHNPISDYRHFRQSFQSRKTGSFYRPRSLARGLTMYPTP